MRHYQSILMPYDGSNVSGEALETAEMIAKNQGAVLTVLYVHDAEKESSMWPLIRISGDPYLLQSQTNLEVAPPPLGMMENLPNKDIERIESNIPDTIISGAKSRIKGNLDVNYEVISGRPAKKIIKYADENEIDLIVIGSRGLSGLQKYTMGSISHKVSNEVACSIMIVR